MNDNLNKINDKLVGDGYRYLLPEDPSEGNSNDKITQRIDRIARNFKPLLDSRVSILKKITSAYLDAISTHEIEGADYIKPRLLFDGISSIRRKEKHHSWQLLHQEGDKIDEIKAETIKRGFTDFLNDANFHRAFKSGEINVSLMRALHGIGYAMVGLGDPKNNPINISALRISQVFVPESTIEWKDVNEAIIVFDLEYDDFREQFKDNPIVKDMAWGKLPFLGIKGETKQDTQTPDRMGQYLMYFNKREKQVLYVGGENMTIFEKFEGSEYPFYDLSGNAILPIFKFPGFEAIDGFFNRGFGDLLYQPNNIQGLNINNRVRASINATKNFPVIDIKDSLESDVTLSIYEAKRDFDEGGTPFILNPVDDEGGAIKGTSQVGGISAGMNESTMINYDLDTMVINSGVRLKEVETSSAKTATAIQSEIEKSNEIIRDISDRGADQKKLFLELCYSLIKKNGNRMDTRSVSLDGFIIDGVNVPNTTRGEVIKLMQSPNPTIMIDAMSGTRETTTEKINKLQIAMQMLGGTPQAVELGIEASKALGFNISTTQNEQPTQEPTGTTQKPAQPQEVV